MAESWYAEGRYVVSPHNYAPEVRQGLDLPPDGRVTIFDGTIRKVLMMPGARARVADTVRLGEMLAELGITESLLIVQWRGDTQPVELELEAARALLARNLPINFTVATDVAMTDQWKLAVDCPRDVGARMIDIMLPATDGMIRQAGTTREGVLERMDEVFAYAHEQKLTPAFTLADAARCDLEFLVQLCNHALALGAVRFDLSDSAGTMSPDAMRYFIRTLRGRLTRAVPITVHVHDDFGLATASAVAATTAGALPEASVTGASYRSGFAALEEVALALEALYGLKTGLDLTRLPALSEFVEELTGPLTPYKSIVGKHSFVRDNPTAIIATLRGGPAVFPPPGTCFTPQMVGREPALRWMIWSATRPAVRAKLESMGLPADAATVEKVRTEVRREITTRDGYPYWLEDDAVGAVCQRMAGTS